MKRNLLNITAALLLSFGSVAVFAQQEEEEAYIALTPKWVPAKGYWVVETNTKTPGITTLYFYNDNNLLVYKEKMEGVRVNINKRRIKNQLKKILEGTLALYETRKISGEDEMLAKNIIAGK